MSDLCPDCMCPKDSGKGWHMCAEDGGKGVRIDRLRAELDEARAELKIAWADCEPKDGVGCGACSGCVDRARAEVQRLREECAKASAELRHAWKGSLECLNLPNWRTFDSNLVSKAIQILERAALASSEAPTDREAALAAYASRSRLPSSVMATSDVHLKPDGEAPSEGES